MYLTMKTGMKKHKPCKIVESPPSPSVSKTITILFIESPINFTNGTPSCKYRKHSCNFNAVTINTLVVQENRTSVEKFISCQRTLFYIR